MADAFLSYTQVDRDFALASKEYLEQHLGVTAFMAEVSLVPGDIWPEKIWDELESSRVAIFLMSQAACQSPAVNQEFGGAHRARKRLIPVVWDMSPSDLPGWIGLHQALDLRNKDEGFFAEQLKQIAKDIKMDKLIGAVALTALAGLFVWGLKDGG